MTNTVCVIFALQKIRFEIFEKALDNSSQIEYNNCDSIRGDDMKRERYTEDIKNRINQSDIGTVFVLTDFSDIAETDVVRKAITRLEKKAVLARIMRGVYYKPEYNELLGEVVAPSPNKVAHALARNFGWTIVPCGDTALNLLGLSTQVPSAWVYVSDGAYKEYSFDNTVIKFKRTTNKEISRLSYKTALTIQALKALGKDNISEQIINRLKKALSKEDKEKMLTEAKSATSWVYEYIKKICKDEKK